jgi:hypothetical protein
MFGLFLSHKEKGGGGFLIFVNFSGGDDKVSGENQTSSEKTG